VRNTFAQMTPKGWAGGCLKYVQLKADPKLKAPRALAAASKLLRTQSRGTGGFGRRPSSDDRAS